MVDIEYFRKIALRFPVTNEEPHFEVWSFRFKGKIFSTWWEKEDKAMVKLTPEQQSVFCSMGDSVFYPVPGSWGQKGATFVNLRKVRKDMFKDALTLAYEGISAKKNK
ncbi:MAG TPA: MmcQ/YjbR family DNA-binding protein [Saprospiraceae bacterium]|nr:MmcQ/YjbR family DNA-binding protein [Saprospiraceae bacterium]